MLKILAICMFIPFCMYGQQEGEHYFSGLFTYNARTENSFRVNSSGTFNNTGSLGYFVEGRINKGRFISKNRAVSYGVIGSCNYSESDYFKTPNGDARHMINYRLGAQIGLIKVYEIIPRFFATVNNEFVYTFGWNSSNDSAYARMNTHSVSYRLSPGLLFRLNPRFALQLNLSLATVSLTRTQYSYPQSTSSNNQQSIDFNILSGATLANLNFGVLYFPFTSKRQKQP